MKEIRIAALCFMFLSLFSQSLSAQYPAVLPLSERAEIVNTLLEIRLEKVLPELMRRENIDMWIIPCREYNEDPVFLTMVPAPSFAARRTTILIFFDRGEEGIEKLAVSRYGIGTTYKGVWDPEQMGQWECLGEVVRERRPTQIGINFSDTFAFGDGLTASLKEKLIDAIGESYADKIVSAENLAVGWLETRTEEELEIYHHIVAIARTIITEAFSNAVITPGVTTNDEVRWWMRQKISELGLDTWFHPSVDIQRRGGVRNNDNVIRRGDLLHCDIGITYLRLNTDTQELAYVLLHGEKEAPLGLRQALTIGNTLQDILTDAYKFGRTGNEILAIAQAEKEAQGIKGSIYTHPLGYHGHAAGPTIGLWDQQDFVPGKGDYPLYYHTCYAIELNVKVAVPEWDGQEVTMGLEQDAVFTASGVFYLDDRQTELHIVK